MISPQTQHNAMAGLVQAYAELLAEQDAAIRILRSQAESLKTENEVLKSRIEALKGDG